MVFHDGDSMRADASLVNNNILLVNILETLHKKTSQVLGSDK